ncbi:MAG: right-handed parallel beta-helix repeat-containing protein [bacterium]|nr:right-handed parallel beta-helix repeat-containing protein [bacterium]
MKPEKPGRLLHLSQLAFLIIGITFSAHVWAATFTVTGTADSGAGSLRQAILDANANPGLDTIDFNISGAGPHTIAPLFALPTVTDPVVIDGTTQPGFSGSPIIELDGSSAGTSANGLRITAGSSLVKGLVINRFGGDGIRLETAGGNRIEGCFIGTNPNGTAALGNHYGIQIVGTPNNTVGGTASGTRNVISGNTGQGIRISGNPATGNVVAGNFIGTDVTGTVALGNGHFGVSIQDAANNTIGGTTAETRNLISANLSGIGIVGITATGNGVQGNYIGTDITGTVDLGNNGNGVGIASPDNTVGGTVPGSGNLISGNNFVGLVIGGANAIGVVVQGNRIGTNALGSDALGNGHAGIQIAGAPGNTIGGTTDGARNLISGNNNEGILVTGAGALGNNILGNFIGTNAAGDDALPNRRGVHLSAAPGNTVGGTTAQARNLISGNGGEGVLVSGAGAAGNQILGNFIGSDVTGTVVLGNNHLGVSIHSSGNTLGGQLPGAGNLIAGSKFSGIGVSGTDNVIQGNTIGTDATGTVLLGNGDRGIGISGAGNTVGGTAAGEGNVIAHNISDGVLVVGGTGNRIQGNSIHSNGGLGIDLFGINGVNLNDAGDADTGGNELQNYPVLNAVTSNSIAGDLNSAPNMTFRIEFFANGVGDASGFGEGETFLGAVDVTTDASGNASFNAAVSVGSGQFVTATATDPDNNTSEFSAWFQGPTNLPPNCAAAVASIEQIWPPNHKMTDIEIVGVTDPDGDPVTITIQKITQDEPVNSQGDGNSEADGAGLGASTAQVRAERAGGGNGRVYEIFFLADDGKGGECPGSVTVCVPHDRGKKGGICVDDGQLYDSVTGDPLTAAAKPAVVNSDAERAPEAEKYGFGVEQNYPNPFNPDTAIPYQLPEAGEVSLIVYNTLGQQVKVLMNERQEAGYYRAVWDGKDRLGRQVASGIYLVRLEAGTFTQVRKMVLLK